MVQLTSNDHLHDLVHSSLLIYTRSFSHWLCVTFLQAPRIYPGEVDSLSSKVIYALFAMTPLDYTRKKPLEFIPTAFTSHNDVGTPLAHGKRAKDRRLCLDNPFLRALRVIR